MNESKSHFYVLKKQESSKSPGSSRLHLAWLKEDQTVVIIYCDRAAVKLIRFSFRTGRFENPTTLDCSLLALGSTELNIQRIFPFQNRILIIKQTFSSDSTPILVSDPAMVKLYPIKLDINFDFLYNGVCFDGMRISIFGGATVGRGESMLTKNAVVHNRLFQIDMCTLSSIEFNPMKGELVPPARCSPCFESYGHELILTGGYRAFPFDEGRNNFEDLWIYTIHKRKWEILKIENFCLTGLRAVSRDNNRMVFIFGNKFEPSFSIFHTEKRLVSSANLINRGVFPYGVVLKGKLFI